MIRVALGDAPALLLGVFSTKAQLILDRRSLDDLVVVSPVFLDE